VTCARDELCASFEPFIPDVYLGLAREPAVSATLDGLPRYVEIPKTSNKTVILRR
jgi:hypothetical protein